MESDENDDLAEDGSRTATLRLIPDDSNSRRLIVCDELYLGLVNLITGLMQQCNLLNPDVDEEVADSEYSSVQNTIDQSGQVEADDSWFDEETPDDEVVFRNCRFLLFSDSPV